MICWLSLKGNDCQKCIPCSGRFHIINKLQVTILHKAVKSNPLCFPFQFNRRYLIQERYC